MAIFTEIDALLRGRGRYEAGGSAVPWGSLALIFLVSGFVYGAVMGSFGSRPLQALYAGLKVPLLLTVSTLVCTPTFFVISTLLGLRDDFPAVRRGIASAQSTLAVGLLALSPLTMLAYASSDQYAFAVVFNGFLFACATVAGQIGLARHYGPLLAKNPRHRIARGVWVGLYTFVTIQSAWVLRPYIGAPNLETRFFREGAWSNAYVVVAEAVWNLIEG